MKETTFQKISRKTGRKPISCKCKICKSQCTTTPGLGTPEDIEKIVDAGYGDRIFPTDWGTGKYSLRVTQDIIFMYQPEFIDRESRCAFFEDGLCVLHDKGLKPTECKLSSHKLMKDSWTPQKALSWNIAKVWLDPYSKDTIKRIREKLNEKHTSAP